MGISLKLFCNLAIKPGITDSQYSTKPAINFLQFNIFGYYDAQKLNCWEFMPCGLKIGGRNVDHLGIERRIHIMAKSVPMLLARIAVLSSHWGPPNTMIVKNVHCIMVSISMTTPEN